MQSPMRRIIAIKGFKPFWISLFLSTLNDSMFKTVLSLVAINSVQTDWQADQMLWWVQAIFVVPLLLFSARAGYWADHYPKNQLMRYCKLVECLALSVGIVAFWWESSLLLLIVFAVMACRMVVYSPAKFALIPEMCGDNDLSRANGLVEMATFFAIIMGSALAAFLYDIFADRLVILGGVFLCFGIIGYIATGYIPRTGNVLDKSLWSPYRFWSNWPEVYDRALRTRGLRSGILGLASFYAIGLVFQPALLLFAEQAVPVSYTHQGIWLALFGFMMGLGSLIAGKLSGAKVEYGLIPIGAIGLTAGLSFLACAQTEAAVLLILTAMGLFSGCFIVPLHALIQLVPDAKHKGLVIAVSNIAQGALMLAAVGLLAALTHVWHWQARHIMGLLAVLSGLLCGITLWQEPRFFLRFLLCSFVHWVYRLKVLGEEHLPLKKGALLVANHVSFVDGLVLVSIIPRFVRFLLFKRYYDYGKPLFKYFHLIPIEAGNAQLVSQSIQRAREELIKGHVIGIFAEGALTRTGQMMRFRSGFERIVGGIDVPIVPIYLDRLWGSFFSHRDKKLFRRWPRFRRMEVVVSVGAPLPSHTKAWQVRQVIQNLGADTRMQAPLLEQGLADAWWRVVVKRYLKRVFFTDQDSSRCIDLMIQASELAQGLRAQGIQAEERVGLSFPRTPFCYVIILALTTLGCSIVMLPADRPTSWRQTMTRRFGLRHVIVSADQLIRVEPLEESMGVVPEPESGAILLGYPRNTRLKRYTPMRRFFFRGYFRPMAVDPHREHVILMADAQQERVQAGAREDASGEHAGENSGERTKWVILSHANIISAIQSISQVLTLTKRDRLLAVLSLHHVFGYVWNVWFPLLMGLGIVFPRLKPDDCSELASLALRKRATCIVTSPWAYAKYAQEVSPQAFARIRYAIVGAGRVTPEIFSAVQARFGVDLLEGFGLAECSGILAMNLPDFSDRDHVQQGRKLGSVGQLLPGIGARIVNPETWTIQSADEWGILWVKGLNVMRGYWDQDGSILHHGADRWYNTGLTAKLDDEGFLFFRSSPAAED